jgi:hypothetical protein
MNVRLPIFAFLTASMLLCAVVEPTHAAPAILKGFLIGGYHDKPEDAFASIGLLVDFLAVQGAIYFENVWVDSGSYRDLNLDIYYSLVTLVAVYGYVGSGVSLVFAESEDGEDSESRAGLNLVAGVKSRLIPLKPFLQFRYTALEDWEDPLSIGVGIHF